MKIKVSADYNALSKQIADDLISFVQAIEEPLICPASGDTPAGLYKELSNRYEQKKIDPSKWNFVALDEWSGMNGKDEGSCRYYLDRQLFGPLHVDAKRLCFFDGRANADEQIQQVEDFIKKRGGIDVSILGLGMNGHIGMNEPFTSPALRTHVAVLDSVTQQVGQKYFSEEKHLTHGITLGIANLLESKKIFLVISGKKKAAIVKKLIEGPITEELPGSLLRQHPQLTIYLDSEAASLVEKHFLN
jgi:glucosamine-6-phosphate isomerase